MRSGTGPVWFKLVTLARQWSLVALVSIASGIAVWIAHTAPGSAMWDAGQFHLAVRAYLAGQNPYAAVAEHWPFPLFYPLPALLVFAPFAVLPELPARIGWAMFQGGVLTWAAVRYRPVLLIGLLSASYLDALVLGQFSPLLTAATLVPPLGFVWAAKPTLGAALFVAYPSRKAVLGIAGITLLSILIFPQWLLLWLEAARYQIHTPPVFRPGGVLLLLALLRWRQPEARLVAALALTPHSTSLYDALPLFLVPRARSQAYLLAILTLIVAFLVPVVYPWVRDAGEPLADHLGQRWLLTLVFIYIPVLIMVLRTDAGGYGARGPADLWPRRDSRSGFTR